VYTYFVVVLFCILSNSAQEHWPGTLEYISWTAELQSRCVRLHFTR